MGFCGDLFDCLGRSGTKKANRRFSKRLSSVDWKNYVLLVAIQKNRQKFYTLEATWNFFAAVALRYKVEFLTTTFGIMIVCIFLSDGKN